jgi:uncharacterized glyoxalase superfamily protein PhnB
VAVGITLNIYVPNVDEVFQRAIDAGCKIIESPKKKDGDPDRPATFKDFAGNTWSVGTQL